MEKSEIFLNFHTDLCPCGSGQILKECCLTKRYDTRPKGQNTGYGHSKCYARELLDCSLKISREHYLIHSLLQLFGEKNINIAGLPWAKNEKQNAVSSKSLTGKMLCERHNGALSQLDNLAKIFFGFFINEWGANEPEIYLTNGDEIERWFLKTLCGLVASGNATLNGNPLIQWAPPIEWLNILFGEKYIDNNAGLYYIIGRYHYQIKSIIASPVFKTETNQPIALALAVSGIGFLFSMEEPPDVEKPTPSGAALKYRPKILQISKGKQTREAHFGWPNGPFIVMEVT